MKKNLLAFVLPFVILLFSGAGCVYQTVTLNTNTSANPNNVAVFDIKLSIAKETGDPVVYTVKATNTMTALAALQKASTDNNVVVVTKKYDFGELVESIDGVASSGAKFWLFTINGDAATVGAGAYSVKEGDTIGFVYTSGE